ncbi:Thyroglobulin [Exaiptasia diaphana]|nr:Thyroglobulin [Exaiptasia diaphana]
MKAKFEIRVFLSSAVTKDAINQTRHEIKAVISDGINISDAGMIIEVNCPIGHYHNQTTDSCERCPVNTYQESEGQLACIRCKTGLSTLGLEGAWTNTQCRECEDFEKTEIKVQCEKWRRAGECQNNRPKMFDKCPQHCRFCTAVKGKAIKTKARRRQGVNLKAVIPALVVPTVILVSIVLLVVLLLRRKRRRREDENQLSLDTMMKKTITLDKHNNDKYKNAIQVQQLHVRFHEDKKLKKKKRNKNKSSPIKAVLKREQSNEDDDLYVRIPLKKTKVIMNDKKAKKKKDDRKLSSEEIEQVSTSLELQEISAQMDATQV